MGATTIYTRELNEGPVELGAWYWVPSIARKVRKGTVWLPVLPNPHSDEGLNQLHYNLDTRFLTQKDFERLVGDHAQHVELADGKLLMSVAHQCQREKPHRDSYYNGMLYQTFENACAVGMVMANMKCPHRGTDLSSCPVVNDIVTCPAHGLRWRVSSGEFVKPIKITLPAELRFKRKADAASTALSWLPT